MNKLGTIMLAMVIAVLVTAQAWAGSCTHERCRVKNVTGEVYNIRKDFNRLYIIDETTREKWDFFVHTDVLDSLNNGDRVRVYYQSPRLPVTSVQKMTPVEYNEQGQNAGYIYKAK